MTTNPAMPELPEHAFMHRVHNLNSIYNIKYYTGSQMNARYTQGYNDALATLQAQPAEVSDADILTVAEFVGLIGPGSRIGESHSAAVRFARAILALRPQAVPMTRDVFGALKKVHETAVYLGAGECSITMDLVREIDAIFERSTAHHGITAPAGGEE